MGASNTSILFVLRSAATQPIGIVLDEPVDLAEGIEVRVLIDADEVLAAFVR